MYNSFIVIFVKVVLRSWAGEQPAKLPLNFNSQSNCAAGCMITFHKWFWKASQICKKKQKWKPKKNWRLVKVGYTPHRESWTDLIIYYFKPDWWNFQLFLYTIISKLQGWDNWVIWFARIRWIKCHKAIKQEASKLQIPLQFNDVLFKINC